jgi:formylglycine-generating enzyme required for sulfatase activity
LIRVIRGGSWKNDAIYCRVADRSQGSHQIGTFNYLGFRVARSSVP